MGVCGDVFVSRAVIGDFMSSMVWSVLPMSELGETDGW